MCEGASITLKVSRDSEQQLAQTKVQWRPSEDGGLADRTNGLRGRRDSAGGVCQCQSEQTGPGRPGEASRRRDRPVPTFRPSDSEPATLPVGHKNRSRSGQWPLLPLPSQFPPHWDGDGDARGACRGSRSPRRGRMLGSADRTKAGTLSPLPIATGPSTEPRHQERPIVP